MGKKSYKKLQQRNKMLSEEMKHIKTYLKNFDEFYNTVNSFHIIQEQKDIRTIRTVVKMDELQHMPEENLKKRIAMQLSSQLAPSITYDIIKDKYSNQNFVVADVHFVKK